MLLLFSVLREAGTKPKDIQSIFDAINLDHVSSQFYTGFRFKQQYLYNYNSDPIFHP